MTEIKNLINEIKQYKNYPTTMDIATGEIPLTAFFPGGSGTFNNSETISDKKIMVLGQDWGMKQWYGEDKNKGEGPFQSILKKAFDTNLFSIRYNRNRKIRLVNADRRSISFNELSEIK